MTDKPWVVIDGNSIYHAKDKKDAIKYKRISGGRICLINLADANEGTLDLSAILTANYGG